MEQDIYLGNNQENQKKKKTGLIIAIISGLVLLVLITAGVSYVVIGQMQPQNKTEVVEQKQSEKTKTKETYFEEISVEKAAKLAEAEDVVIVIGKESCSHCKTYKPKIKQFAKDKKLKVYYVDLDVKENKDTFSEYSKLQVEGTPTTLFFHKGKVVERVVGDAGNEKIETTLKNAEKQGFQIA